MDFIAAIYEKRRTAITELLARLKGLLEQYETSEPSDNYDVIYTGEQPTSSTGFMCGNRSLDCDAMVLGYLRKGMRAAGLLPPPEPPYEGLSFASLVADIEKMRMQTSCPDPSYGWSNRCHTGGLLNVSDLERKLTGLELSDFEERDD
jgi:hypothetical protein